MSKHRGKKIILGSTLAGMVLAGPGLSVTSSSNLFQTSELQVGYRVAQAKEDKEAKKADQKAAESKTEAKDAAAADKHCCSGECSEAKECSGDKKCSADKKCSGDKKCAADKKDAEKKSTDKSCGAGTCGSDKK